MRLRFKGVPEAGGVPGLTQRQMVLVSGGLGLVAVLASVVIGVQMIDRLDLARLQNALTQLAPWQWALALAATGLSFLSIGHYDATWHRMLRSGVAPARARSSGMAAVAVSQSLGATAVTAALVRWRLLPELPVLTVAGLSAGVGLSFLLCWGAITILAAAHLGASLDVSVGWGLLAAASALGLALLTARRRLSVRWQDAARMALCTALDITFAGLALWLLLPDPTALPLVTVLAAYTLALGAGLISNAPGGAGPFDLALLALLPAIPVEDLLAAIIAFRVVYYLIPFVIGATALMRAPRLFDTPPQRRRADWALSHQSGRIRQCAGGWAHVVPVAGVPVVLGDPEAPNRLPRRSDLFYKISARYAATLRRAGWRVWRLADEAVLPLSDWTLDTPGRRRLRRALKTVAKAGVTVELATGSLNRAELRRIARIWSRTHGGELGLTVGRFETADLDRQKVVLIRQGGRTLGFVTFNTGQDGWSLDLLRYLPDLPNGALYAALVCGIEAAAQDGAAQVSLGAVPATEGVLARWAGGKAGLRQFKQSFDPVWQPLYLGARHDALLAVIGPILALKIQRPLARTVTRLHNNMQISHLHSAQRAGRTGRP